MVPLLRKDLLFPIDKIGLPVVRTPEPNVAPCGGSNYTGTFGLVHLGHTERGIMFPQAGEDFVIEPGGMAKLKGCRSVLGQDGQEILQCRQIFSQIGRKLEEDSARMQTQRRLDAK